MAYARVIALTSLTMIAFAGNSLLCRAAFQHTAIDAASFTSIRIISGALMLWLVVRIRGGVHAGRGNWISAFALFAYAAGFSFAYTRLPASTGALLLFTAVQATMIGHGLWTGERLDRFQLVGFLLAFGGLVGLLLPGLSAPPLPSAILMLAAGTAWGVYSIRGRGEGDPTMVTAGNFWRAIPVTLILSVLMSNHANFDEAGVAYAFSSGALASATAYVIWYMALPALKDIHAAAVQLTVPVIASLGGIVFLAEQMTLRLVFAAIAILGGISMIILKRR